MIDLSHFSSFFVANWKLNSSFEFINNFISSLSIDKSTKKCVVICAPYIYLNYLEVKRKDFYLGAQDCSCFEEGAYTGEISAKMLNEVGVNFCIVGHSERRQYFKESNEIVKLKAVRLIENNIIPIYISSDGVFDGLKGGYIETDKKNPVNCYGTIKNEVEDYLLKSGNKFMILRMGRVFGTDLCDDTIITNTIRQLKERKTLLCANDEIFTPLYIEDLCKAIIKLIRKRYEGVLHLISIESISRYEIAKTIQKYFNLRNIEIIPCKINSLGLLEKRPLLINLDDNKFNNLVKTEHCDIKHYLEIIDTKS